MDALSAQGNLSEARPASPAHILRATTNSVAPGGQSTLLTTTAPSIGGSSQTRPIERRGWVNSYEQTWVNFRERQGEAASDPYIPAIHKNVLDENETFKELLMPKYRYMVTIFQQKMWLAEPETRPFLPKLVEFVYVWDKILNSRLPREIAGVIGHTEENLKPFYTHLEQMHDRLRSKIS